MEILVDSCYPSPGKLQNSSQKGGSGEKAFIVLGLDYSLLNFKAIMALLN